jgi:hypothetical protein
LVVFTLAFACEDAEPPADPRPAGPETLWIEIADQPFELELALDREVRFRGMGGRTSIAPNGGMLFVNRVSRPQAMVMRDCLIAIDVAFLDAGGRVVAIHAMLPEPPRRPGEGLRAYESRLPQYSSGAPALFAIETAGGRMSELGLRVGDRLVFDGAGLASSNEPGEAAASQHSSAPPSVHQPPGEKTLNFTHPSRSP